MSPFESRLQMEVQAANQKHLRSRGRRGSRRRDAVVIAFLASPHHVTLDEVARVAGTAIHGHRLEIRGRCPDCRRGARGATA